MTVQKSAIDLWDREVGAWLRTLLKIDDVPEVAEFGDKDGGRVLATYSQKHLALTVKLKNRSSALLVLAF